MIDAFRACPDGVYDDGVVVVRRTAGSVLSWDGTTLRHEFDAVDNDLAGRLAGVVPPEVFERVFTGVVLTTATDPLAAWRGFYGHTLDGLTGAPRPGGSVAEFAPIYRRARTLVRGRRVLDVGSCFGFLPILLADDGYAVVASDLNAGNVALLRRVDPRLPVVTCSAADLPVPDDAVDTVFAVHLLEHVDAGLGAAAVREALRVARQRVVLAVPYEEVPDPAYGHVRTVTHDDLDALGRSSGWRYDVTDVYGGWLVLDRP